jgi:CheY-like chemotaxis protein
MSSPGKTLLCIDDHQTALSGWCLYLQGMGYNVLSAAGSEEGLQLFATNPVDAVILDYAMPEMDGAEAASAMKHIKPDIPVILFSGYSRLPQEASQNVDAFVTKGEPPQVLVQTLEALLGAEKRGGGAAA